MIVCFISLAQARIDLRGTIQKQDGIAISEARVFLKNHRDISTVSDDTGGFVLTDVNVHAGPFKVGGKSIRLLPAGNRCGFFVRPAGIVSDIGIEIFQADGRRMESVHLTGPGEHFVPFSLKTQGVHFYKVSTDKVTRVFQVLPGSGMSDVQISGEPNMTPIKSAGKRSVSLVDTLVVSIGPYRTELIGLESYEKNNMQIAMTASNAWNNCSCAPLEHVGSMVKIIGKEWDNIPLCDFEMGQWCDTIWGIKDGKPTSDFEQPVHTVVFNHNFLMDTTEIPQLDFDTLMKKTYPGYVTPKKWSTLYGKGDRYPAYAVSWDDAALFCNARSKRDLFDTAYSYTGIMGTPGSKSKLVNVHYKLFSTGYRLPTEAEWEYCARSWLQTDYWWTKNAADYRGLDTIRGINLYAIWSQNSWNQGPGNAGFGTQPVDTLSANFYNLCGMVGNVSEWCNDLFAPYQWGTFTNPVGDPDWTSESTKSHVIRGGNWGGTKYYLRSANRYFYAPGDDRDIFIGFRTIRIIGPEF
jgi:formylglycine-generating enzyme required for sulfatase activity